MSVDEIAVRRVVHNALHELLNGTVRREAIEKNLCGARDKTEIAEALEQAYLNVLQKLYCGFDLTERCVFTVPCPHHSKDQWKDLESDLEKIRTVLRPYGNATGTLGDKVASVISRLQATIDRRTDYNTRVRLEERQMCAQLAKTLGADSVADAILDRNKLDGGEPGQP